MSSTILPKNQMTEEDIKLNYITSALLSRGWQNKITMETKVQFTDGKINLHGNIVARETPKKADYILYIERNYPIAIVEAKDNNHSVSFGMQQAMTYAQMLDIPFAYSSNGDAFYEHDFLTGLERQISLEEFPTYDELINRYKSEANSGEGITDKEMEIIHQPYYTSQNTYPPRYYQRIAINRTVDAIAKGQNRLLLVMATGTGKTYTAFQIVYRLLKNGIKKKILYLTDRNILVDQSIQQDFAPLEKTIHKINFAKDDPSTITSHEVYFSLYQQLADGEEGENTDAEEETELRLALFNIVQGTISTIMNAAGFGSASQTTLPAEMITTIEDCGFFESIPLWAVTLIGGLFITVLSFVLIMTVYGRFFKLYMYTALAPIPLSTFAGEPTQNVGKSFIKSYCAVLLEGAVIVLACIIFSVFASSPPAVNPDAAAVTQVWSYIGELVFNMLVLVGAVKMSDRIIREMMGL